MKTKKPKRNGRTAQVAANKCKNTTSTLQAKEIPSVNFQVQADCIKYFAIVHGNSVDEKSQSESQNLFPKTGKIFALPYPVKPGSWSGSLYQRGLKEDLGSFVVRLCHSQCSDSLPKNSALLGSDLLQRDSMYTEHADFDAEYEFATFYPWRSRPAAPCEMLTIPSFKVETPTKKYGGRGIGGRRHRRKLGPHRLPMGCMSVVAFDGFYSRCEAFVSAESEAKKILDLKHSCQCWNKVSKESNSLFPACRKKITTNFTKICDSNQHEGIHFLQPMNKADTKWQADSVVALVLVTLDSDTQQMVSMDGTAHSFLFSMRFKKFVRSHQSNILRL